jgi:hypothetical protein
MNEKEKKILSLAVPLEAGCTVLDFVTGRTGFSLISEGCERMCVCVQKIRIKHSIIHPSPVIFALRPVL